MPSGIGEILCVHNLFRHTSFAREGSATSTWRCQVSSPLPTRPESSVRLKPLSNCALVWSHLIYAGINILWDFFLFIFLASLPHESSPSNSASFYCLLQPGLRHRGALLGLTKWLVLILIYSKLNSTKTVATAIAHTKAPGNSLISPFSHLLFRAGEGFPSSSQGELLTGQRAVLWALCLCVPLAQLSQNCCPPNIIPYLLGHWKCDFLPASDWVLENPCLKLKSSLSFSDREDLSFSECSKFQVPVLHVTLDKKKLILHVEEEQEWLSHVRLSWRLWLEESPEKCFKLLLHRTWVTDKKKHKFYPKFTFPVNTKET